MTHWTTWQCWMAAVVGPRVGGVYQHPHSDDKQLPILSLNSMGPNCHLGHQLGESWKSPFGHLVMAESDQRLEGDRALMPGQD